jgi:hypothetical protein
MVEAIRTRRVAVAKAALTAKDGVGPERIYNPKRGQPAVLAFSLPSAALRCLLLLEY